VDVSFGSIDLLLYNKVLVIIRASLHGNFFIFFSDEIRAPDSVHVEKTVR